MAIHYIDPIGGNDANNGLSFANRKRTLASLAGLAAGDSVRIIESQAPTSLGAVSWTDSSRTLTLPSAKTLEIDPCTDAWTASANVTCSAGSSRKYGATASRFVVAPGFTTGQMAYKTLAAPLDLSGYTSVSFWLNAVSGGTLQGQAVTLRLCSDTAGAVPVKDLPIDMGQTTTFVAGSWVPVFIDGGGALPAGINSIRIDANVDPGSSTFQINNLFACQNKAHADHLSLQSLISKSTAGEPERYPVNSIAGTTVTIGTYRSVQAAPGPAYRGTTESVTTYQVAPTFPNWTSAQRTIPGVSGTEASPITMSFGWDATAMSSQSGITVWTGCDYLSGFFTLNTDWWVINGPGTLACIGDPWSLGSGSQYAIIDIPSLVGITTSFDITAGADASETTLDCVVWCDGAMTAGAGTAGVPQRVRIRRVTGCADSSTTGAAVVVNGGNFTRRQQANAWIDMIDNNMGNGAGAAAGTVGYLRGCVLQNNVNADARSSSGLLVLDNCSLLSTTPVNSTGAITTDGAGVMASSVNGVSTDTRMWLTGFRAQTQSAVRQTASGVAWQIEPYSATEVNRLRPARIPLARVAVDSTGTVTVSVWARRSNTGLTVGIRAFGGQVAGLTATQEDTVTAAADTWEELTISFTPTAKGVVEIEGFAYGGTTYSGFFDSLTVSQS